MTYVLTPEQMRAADAAACAQIGVHAAIPQSDSEADARAQAGADALMREAGRRIAELIRALAPCGRVVAFAGPGNNGGDAFAALAELSAEYERVICTAPVAQASAARRTAEERARAAGVLMRAFPRASDEARALAEGAAVVVDALLGTGARLPLAEALQPAVAALDARVDRGASGDGGARRRCVLAIDVPSGVDALTGTIAEPAVRATHTIALGALKPGLLLEPARAVVGELWLADIGIAPAILREQARTFAALDDGALLALLPRRAENSDKRSAGAPLIVAGSVQFPGAAVLCARGAARAGAGYVTVATPHAAAAALRAHLVEQVVVEYADDAPAERVVQELLDVAQRNGAIGIGPGLALDERTGTIVRDLLRASDLPAVVDASALFHLAKHLDVLRGKRVVVTPHAGEFARLSGLGTVKEGTRVARIREFVERTGVATLLKGQDTLIYGGGTLHVNTTGTSALATAGTGDVLTGMIATLLAQGLEPLDAACAAAYWHGLAAERCARKRHVGVVAGDLPEAFGAALPHLTERPPLRRIFGPA